MNKIVKIGFITFLLSVFALTSANASLVKKTLFLRAGSATTLNLNAHVSDVLIANPAVADVGTMRADRLYFVGKSVGDTNVLAFDGVGNQMADITVHVSVDSTHIRASLKNFFPQEKIEAKAVKNDIVLTGTVSTPIVANQVRELASRFLAQSQSVVDLMKVSGEQQVMLKVRVIEAKRDILREYGFESDYNALNANPTSGAHFNSIGGQTGLTSLTPFATGTLFITNSGNYGPFKLALSALEKDGLVNTLAEPNLTAISGETASFLAGGEFPVPSARDAQGNITLEFKQFGVALNFVPTVLSSERISLQLSTEVSEKSNADGVTLVGTIIPGLTTRKAETTVQMASGSTLMIAGLLKSSDVDALSGFPGMESIPIIGELFKSKSFSRNESELVFLVTPYIVSPYAEEAGIDKRRDDHESSQLSLSPLTHKFIENIKASYGDKNDLWSGKSFRSGYMME